MLRRMAAQVEDNAGTANFKEEWVLVPTLHPARRREMSPSGFGISIGENNGQGP
jgi:hypothetical protein